MNSFGKLFRVSLFGESHGPAVGVTIDGCPAGLAVSEEDIAVFLSRRKSGKAGTTPRTESDLPQVLSGLYRGTTTGAPITVITANSNIRSDDYAELTAIPRPGHADFTAGIKYAGYADQRGGGHFSGRLTWGLVVAGTFARKILPEASFRAEVIQAGGSEDIEGAVALAQKENDTIGGIVECRVDGIPAGLGEPFFLSAESAISAIVFSIPAKHGMN